MLHFDGMAKDKDITDSPTIGDVAAAAGVSMMTVSRSIREPDKVSEATRAKVQNAIARTGYVVNSSASALKSRRTRVVAIIVPSIRNSLFSATIQGLARRLRERNYSLIVADSEYDRQEETRLLADLLSQRPCGLVLHEMVHTDEALSLIKRTGVPVVEVGDLADDPIDSVVSYSNRAATKAMTEYLIARGYQRIAFVSLPVSFSDRSAARQQGYKEALSDAGMILDPSLILEAESGYEAGTRAISRLMEIDLGVDAVFFAGDVHAFGALFECQRRGWRVPHDIAIAGFDDYELAQQVVPGITTLSIPRVAIGEHAADIIIDRSEGNLESHQAINLGFSVLPRGST